uniref:Folate receptor-like domain-containing protein n=1 Tax=Branchiostoma floridae TaxID=7739 RepID=C3Z7R5_BRAFL|eukprot:XP_002595408.1 hypothetical protein BRAFLDRAFT_69238 [Branchiostoma floridae]
MKSYLLRDWSAVIVQLQCFFLGAIVPTLGAEVDVTGLTEPLPTEPAGLRYCSLFGNRAPKPEHKLVSCPWFRLDSCCYQEEVDRLFPIVTPPRGADQVCRDHLYYLKCYICSPHQHLFYHEETVTMCEEFCDSIFWACANATLEGERISDLYSNGREYCLDRKFRVEKESSGTCYTVPIVIEQAVSSANSRDHLTASIWISTGDLCLLPVKLGQKLERFPTSHFRGK